MTDATPTLPVICCFFDAAFGDDYERECLEEIALLRSVFQAAERDQMIKSIILERATPEHLKKIIREMGDALTIFHYVGTEATFKNLLGNWDIPTQTPNLRLFFYDYDNSCDEAEMLANGKGAPVVVGFNATLDLPYALQFVKEFYERLLKGQSIRHAFDQTQNNIGPAPEKEGPTVHPKEADPASSYRTEQNASETTTIEDDGESISYSNEPEPVKKTPPTEVDSKPKTRTQEPVKKGKTASTRSGAKRKSSKRKNPRS